MRFLMSLAEQGMGSIITFGINLWLIRNGQAASYGDYVFWYSVAWVLSTCQYTLTVVHLTKLPSGAEHLAERREPERVLLSATLVILLVTVFGVFAGNRFLPGDLRDYWSVLFIPAFLLYQYVRAFAFSRRNVRLAAGLTGGVMVCMAAGFAVDFWAGVRPDATRALLIGGLAYGICAVVALMLLDPGIRPAFRGSLWRRYRHYLSGSGWLVLGAGSAEITSRLYSFMVVGWFGTEALARLSAVQVVIRPAWMLSAAWNSVGFPVMATQHAKGDGSGLFATMLRGAVMTALGSAAWSGGVIVLWPLVSGLLYRGRYEDIGILAWLWGGNVILGSIAVALNTAMLVHGEFRRLALIDLVGAMACTVSCLLLLTHFDYTSSIIGTMAGQATQIVLMAMVLSSLTAARRPAQVTG
jgi:O-antigen/teichoic acid export membrane protein